MRKIVNENINKYLYGPSDEEIEKRLENSDIDLNVLLIKSVENGYLKVVKKAVERGADVHIRNCTPLTEAIFKEHMAIIKYLIENGADVNCSSIGPNRNLQIAIHKNNLDIVKLLVENGAIITHGHLGFAKERGLSEIFDYLANKKYNENH
ncbi:MAG: ankyrin repeat domain-containing protein [bacterium]